MSELRDRAKWPALGAAALAVALLVTVGVVLAAGESDRQAKPVAARASGGVSFSGNDPITGDKVDLSAYRGKPVVINVWASWCSGCSEEAADLQRFAEKHPEAQLIGVDTQDTEGDARSFYARWGWSHPSVFDPHGTIAGGLRLQGLPSTFFLDRQHRVAARIVGATDLAGFEAGLAKALRG